MRKYDKKNKRNIGIILVISALIIVMFSLVINLFLSRDKNEYKVEEKTLVFDKDKTIIKVEKPAVIKTKWNKKYYLIQDKVSTELGNTAITYNEDIGALKLYGKYYEISSGDEINITSGETVIKSTALTKFYKLEDRKYLVVDKEIKSADGLLSTSDFLMIDLDKAGNATLTNHKVNLKTFSATTIVTSNYTFDIANEILVYGSDKIDLKKIIGSSNTYTKEELVPDEEDNNKGNSSENNTPANNGVTGVTDNSRANGDNTTNGGNSSGNTGDKGKNNVVIEEIKKATKRTSVIAVTSTVNKINVDYVIYDPKKEYSSVYMEVKKENSSNIDTIYLNSGSTSYEISNNVFPNTNYELTFKYSYIDDENQMHVETFDKVNITTKKPQVSLKVTRTSKDGIDYLVTTDNSYPLTSGTLTVTKNGEVVSSNEITLNGNTVGHVNITNLLEDDSIELSLTSVKSDETVIKDLSSSYKFRY